MEHIKKNVFIDHKMEDRWGKIEQKSHLLEIDIDIMKCIETELRNRYGREIRIKELMASPGGIHENEEVHYTCIIDATIPKFNKKQKVATKPEKGQSMLKF